MNGLSHCIKRIPLVVFEQGVDKQGEHGQLFLAEKQEVKCLRNLFKREIYICLKNAQMLCSCYKVSQKFARLKQKRRSIARFF